MSENDGAFKGSRWPAAVIIVGICLCITACSIADMLKAGYPHSSVACVQAGGEWSWFRGYCARRPSP